MNLETLAFRHAPIGIALTEARVVRACNPAFAEMFRAGAAEDVAGMPLVHIYPSVEDHDRIGAAGLEMLRQSGRYSDERIMRRLDGSLFWCRVGGVCLTPEEPFARGVWTFADISDERPVIALSPREREVAILTCRGLTAKEIARQLDLSHRTVEQYRGQLLQKCGVRNTAELAALFSGMPV